MNSTQKLVERLRPHTRTRSDYAVAKLLGISQSRMSNYMRGERQIDDDAVIAKAAEIVGDDPAAVLAEFQAEKAKDEKSRAAWYRIAGIARALAHRSVTAVAVAAAIGVGAAVSPSPAQANALAPTSGGGLNADPMYIMLIKRCHRKCDPPQNNCCSKRHK